MIHYFVFSYDDLIIDFRLEVKKAIAVELPLPKMLLFDCVQLFFQLAVVFPTLVHYHIQRQLLRCMIVTRQQLNTMAQMRTTTSSVQVQPGLTLMLCSPVFSWTLLFFLVAYFDASMLFCSLPPVFCFAIRTEVSGLKLGQRKQSTRQIFGTNFPYFRRNLFLSFTDVV